MLVSRFLIYNKKRTLNTILSTTLIITLLFFVSLMFSSFHKYLVQTSLKENNYHVYFKSKDFKKPSFVKTKINDSETIYLKYKNIYKTKKHTKEICEKIKCQNITYNEKLISLYGLTNNSTLESIKKLLITILTILGISSFFITKNTFKLTLNERKKEIGILKSIGMTKIQIVKNLLLEGSINFLIGLIIGVITSLWIAELFLFIINTLLKDILDTKIILTFYLPFIIIAIIFIIIVFYSSIIFSALKISKVSIIELLKENTTFKKKKNPKIFYRLSPIKRLAFSNYYRLKKNYRPIKLCILITSILYLTFTLYLDYAIKSLNTYINLPNYDFFISTKGNKDNYNKLKEFSKNYQKSKIYSICIVKGKLKETSYLDKNYNQEKIIVVKSKKEGIINYIKINKEKNKIQNQNKKYLKNKIILTINDSLYLNPINKIPFGLEEYLTKENIVFFTNNFNKYCQNFSLNLYIKDKKDIAKQLSKINIKDELTYSNIKKANSIREKFVLTVKILLYGVLIIVIIIDILLVTSSIDLTIHQRKKELEILKNIGTRDLNIKKMLLYESLIVIFKTYVLIVPISYLISYTLYQSLNETINVKLVFPLNEIIFSFIITLCIIYYTLKSSCNKIIKKR